MTEWERRQPGTALWLATGTVREHAGLGRWRVDASGLDVVATAERAWSPAAAVAVAVRPERVRL